MPKIVDRERYRKELLWKSFDLFAQKGYASITMREIAKELGVSTGTLYHYFPNKETLFLQLIEEQTEQDISDFLAEAGDPKSLSEGIKTLIDFAAKGEDYFIKQFLLWADFYQQKERSDILNNRILQRVLEQNRKVLSQYLQIQDKVVIDLIINHLNGLIMARMFEGEAISYEEQGELLAKMLVTYLENQKEEG